MSECEMRDTLDLFSARQIDAEDLSKKYPACACEKATSPKGSPGPIDDQEWVRLFLLSPTHLSLKKPSDLNKTMFRVRHLKNAYGRGLSICRLEHARKSEMEYTACSLSRIQKKSNNNAGGVIGVVDFPIRSIRKCPNGCTHLCAYETPLEFDNEGNYLKPSHGDLVNSKSGMSDVDKNASRRVLFNQIISCGEVKKPEQIDDFDVSPYLPKSISSK